ncbi:helix-turn-helix transcriptional regulator [Psychromonas sp. KJ10-10]|uniref:helix-turn-helix transcriptional regulator n=1 Tax=Psychromonas sp. KJ10-10 TaxID=3391823 RepID=UPI0039B518A2
MHRANELITKLQTVETEQQIKKVIFHLIEVLEVDHFLLGIFSPLSMNKTNALTIDNYPEGWRKVYDEQQLMPIDPIIHYCANNHSPLFWENIVNEETTRIKKVIFAGEPSRFYYTFTWSNGLIWYVQFIDIFRARKTEKRLTDALTVIQLTLPTLQDALIRVRKDLFKTEKVILTTREVECLTWATEGKSAWEISRILSLSERTITFHLKNATLKLGCANRYQAIAKAIITGVISPKI